MKMDTERLTEKEFKVLLYFITQGYSKPIIHTCKDGKKHFMAYPAKIEKDLKKEISRVWAANICKKLEEKGILDHEYFLPPRQKNKTEHYYLKNDYHAFKNVIKAIIDTTTSKDRVWIFNNNYFQENINESLVKTVLAEKNYEIRRILDLWDWKPVEAQKLFDEYFKEIEHSEIIESSSEENEKKADSISRYICKREKVSFEEYIKKKVKDQFDIKKDRISYSFPTIHLRLPVFSDEVSPREQLMELEKINKDIFERYPLLKSNYSGIDNHYKYWQKEKLILPILALIKASPMALAEFLYGDWKPSGLNSNGYIIYSQEGNKSLEYPLFRILFIAIGDIALTRSIPGGGEDNYFVLRPNPNSLLLIPLSNYNVYFDAGFSTKEDYIAINDEDLIVVPDENYYWIKSWIEINPTYDAFFLNHNCIRNYEDFIKKLVDKNDKISYCIFNKFSNVMKNILNFIDLQNPIQEELQKKLLYELNLVVLNNNLYEDISKLTKLSDYTKHKYEAYNNLLKYSNKIIILYDLKELNFSLLEDIFPEQIIKREYRIEIENLNRGDNQNE